MALEVRPVEAGELGQALGGIAHYFGKPMEAENLEGLGKLLPEGRVLAALDGGAIVGGAGAYRFETTVPGGGQVPTSGVMAVGVLPTHRRRGALTALMKRQLEDAHERGEPLALLFAAEGGIYSRFGYGLASLAGDIELPKEHARPWHHEPLGEARLVEDDEVLDLLPGIYDRVQAATPGMFTRSRDWWEVRRLRARPSGGDRMNVVIELDGVPEAYALYRLNFGMRHMVTETVLEVGEALGTSPRALDAVWRYLLAIDWVARIDAFWLPLDHPLFHWIREPRRMSFSVLEALWARLVDVGPALEARSFGEGEVVLELVDDFCPWNAGRWHVSTGGVERTEAQAELRLDASALASAYLGGFTFEQLRWGQRLEELQAGAVARADALFRAERLPWSPELF